MKRFFLLLTLVLILPIFMATTPASAKTPNYMRITDHITPLFSDETCDELLFYLPYTYYVKVLNVDGNVAHVEYGETAIDGYTYFDKLFDDELSIENPFPDLTLTTISTTILYADAEQKKSILYIFAERSLKYFGQIETPNGYLFFVEYNDKIGYVKESDIYPFSIPKHANPLTFLPEDTSVPTPSIPHKSTALTPIRIIIISCLLLAGILGVFISIKNKKTPSIEGDYYEEKDYE